MTWIELVLAVSLSLALFTFALAVLLGVDERRTARRGLAGPRQVEKSLPERGRLFGTAPATVLAFAVAFLAIAAGLAIADEAFGAGGNAAVPSADADTDGGAAQDDRDEKRRRAFAEVSFVDVGQGDAVAVRVGDTVVLVDAGRERAENVDSELRRLGAERIDVAVLTHPHEDHVKNVLELALNYHWPIETAVLSESEYWQVTATNRDVLDLLSRLGAELEYVAAGDRFAWGGGDWRVLGPPAGRFTAPTNTQVSNSSVVLLLRIGRKQFLFSGDIYKAAAEALSSRWTSEALGRVAVFLASHHGSKFGSLEPLLEATRPKWAVLSTGRNPFQHPSEEAIARLRSAGASLWCTDADGTITATVPLKGAIRWRPAAASAWWPAASPAANGSCVGR
jgi:competence protein ComEC